MICASCCRRVDEEVEVTGESQLYSPNTSYMLCDACWQAEDTIIEGTGDNVHPDIVQRYRNNCLKLIQKRMH